MFSRDQPLPTDKYRVSALGNLLEGIIFATISLDAWLVAALAQIAIYQAG